MSRHPHADIIHAWAEGAKIQYKSNMSERWIDTTTPLFREGLEYRVKPKNEAAVRYRRYLAGVGVDYFVETVNENRSCDLEIYERFPNFKEWIDKDWQTIEID